MLEKTLSIVGDIHHSWGNGSAGIGLSRHLISPYFENTFMKQEIMIVQRLIKQTLLRELTRITLSPLDF